jgi:4-carboxymuconolactone decarboxylase
MTGKPETSTDGTDLRALGYATMRSTLRGESVETYLEKAADAPEMRDGKLAEDIVEIGLVSVWASLWAREGLGRRERSLVTLGVLIALGADEEIGVHAKVALRNGLTRDELAEVIYHSAGYAGYPRAMAARKAARKALGEQ